MFEQLGLGELEWNAKIGLGSQPLTFSAAFSVGLIHVSRRIYWSYFFAKCLCVATRRLYKVSHVTKNVTFSLNSGQFHSTWISTNTTWDVWFLRAGMVGLRCIIHYIRKEIVLLHHGDICADRDNKDNNRDEWGDRG